MCHVCEREATLIERLKPFLKDDVIAEFEHGFCIEKLTLTLGDEKLTITADGDDGGYFHHKNT